MNVVQIFQDIEETLFLRQLSSQDKLCFIGKPKSLNYIRNFLQNQRAIDQDLFFDLSLFSLEQLNNKLDTFDQYQAIIIVSLEDEEALNEAVRHHLKQTSRTPILNLFSDIFINHLCERPLLKSYNPDSNKIPPVSYGIVTTPRSGSTYLCNLLKSTKLAGQPKEHFRLAVQELSCHCNFNYLKLLNSLQNNSASRQEIFGTKFISHFLFELKRTKIDFSQIFTSLDKLILLVREDKVAQAISLEIAQQTAIWHLQNHSSANNYQAKLNDIIINDELLRNIAHKHRFIKQQEHRLIKMLEHYKVTPLTIIYEDILADANQQIKRILEFLAIDLPSNYTIELSSDIKRMPSSFSQEIRRQYEKREALLKV